MKRILLVVFIAILLSMINVFGQTKPDSTLFRYHISELKEAQKRIAQIDTLKLKYIGIAEYHYAKILEEQKKLKIESNNAQKPK